MVSERTDKRITRTKWLLRDALTVLMEEKGFEGITVRDLTEKAAINRGTFYLHYRDKFDLLEQSEDEILLAVEEITSEINPNDALAYTSQSEPFPIILRLFEFFQENASFMKVLLGPKGDASFQVKLKEMIKKRFIQNIVHMHLKEDMAVPLDFFLSYVSSAHLGIVQHWLENGMEQSPREMTLIAARLTLLGPGHVAGLN
ncbi:TetR/AcrR family transcriptional regulator [Bacillus sp. BRMEA1]|nr:TetR/AcrR family transcriptional regulator [Neobacillus endophyticus]